MEAAPVNLSLQIQSAPRFGAGKNVWRLISIRYRSIERTNERTNTNEHRQAGMGEREEFLFLAVVQPVLVDVQTVSKVMRARRGSAKFEYTHSYEIVKEAYPELWVIKSWSYLSFN
jgi:hypothetical protein